MLALVDFRRGSLAGEGGFDSMSGSGAAITETDTGVGVYAADWTSDASNYGTIALATFDENWVYAYIILDSAPASDLTVLQLRASSTDIGEIVINSSRQLELKENGTQIGSASSALTLGTLYRIGLRQKVGTGADGELQGYLGERHAALASFASASNRTFTAQADSLRVGAIDAVALDARIGYVAASERGWPASWLDLHDVVVGPMGFMGQGGPRTASVSDMVPAYDRAALGERRHDTFQTMSFVSQANFAGGVGQSRLVSADRVLTGIADTRFSGYAFPPRSKQNESDGGTTSWYFNRGTTLYGTVGSNFEVVGTATTIAHGGAPTHQPVVDGNNNVYWRTSSNTVRKYDGSTVSDVTPGNYSIKHVAHYGRHLYAIATLPLSAGLTQDVVRIYPATGDTLMPNLSITPVEDIGTITFCSIAIFHASDTTVALSEASEAAGWTPLSSTPVEQGSQAIYGFYHEGGGVNARRIGLEVTSTDALAIAHMAEFSGYDPDNTTGLIVGTDTKTSGTSLAPTASSAGGFQYAAAGHETSGSDNNGSPEGGWTELADIFNTANNQFYSMWRDSGDASATMVMGATTIQEGAAFNVSIPETSRTGSRLVVLASDDAGQTWIAAPANFSMDLFGTIRASVPTAGALWITSDRGLFRMVGQANETIGGDQILDVGITQQDNWELPVDDNAGNWIASFQGLLYYPVGATVRRFAPNSSDPNDDRAFWPPEDWATKADEVQALVSNEGGIWFGSSGYLWNFNGRGFHQMSAEPAANAYDYLYWHQGKLYIKADPADYYNYHYVNVRPDILIDNGDLDQSDFTTGYLITSSLDFEKAADPKIIRLRESQVSFTAQNTNSGSIAFHYRNGCGTDADPGIGSGGDTGSSWTAWGTHTFADGGYERNVLTTPLQCYRLFVRATLTPGSSGIPVLHYFTIWGQSAMPPVQRVVAQITASVGQVNREGKLLWGSAAEVKKALRVLKEWRQRKTPAETLYHYVSINDGTDGGNEYLCVFTQLEYTLSEQSNDQNQVSFDATISFEELPQ